MESLYRMQIIHKPSGTVVAEWLPGRDFEHDLVAELAHRVAAKGVGIGRTAAHVKADVMAAFRELLLDLKKKV
jgi:hypothetical protein